MLLKQLIFSVTTWLLIDFKIAGFSCTVKLDGKRILLWSMENLIFQ